SKENLLKETLTFLAQEHRSCWMTRLEASDQSPGGQLRAIVEAHFDPSICTPDRIAVWFAFFGEMRYRKTYRERISEFDRERQRRTEDLCRVLIAAEGPNYLDAAEVAEALESFADGLWLNIMLYPECLSPESARNHIHAYLAGMFPASFGRRSPVSIRSVG
ncbi:MAG: TetR family transcriptional regulator C-terminal domain-containing protein, partial [Pseudomonadota bacterium]